MNDFNSGKCSLQCDGNQHQCNRMGYWASSIGGRGDLYLKTQGANALPFCSKIYMSILIDSTSLSNNIAIRIGISSNTWNS
jgi:hypothetical protein